MYHHYVDQDTPSIEAPIPDIATPVSAPRNRAGYSEPPLSPVSYDKWHRGLRKEGSINIKQHHAQPRLAPLTLAVWVGSRNYRAAEQQGSRLEPQPRLATPLAPQRCTQTRWYGTGKQLSLE